MYISEILLIWRYTSINTVPAISLIIWDMLNFAIWLVIHIFGRYFENPHSDRGWTTLLNMSNLINGTIVNIVLPSCVFFFFGRFTFGSYSCVWYNGWNNYDNFYYGSTQMCVVLILPIVRNLTAGGLALETVVGNSTAGEVTVTSFGNVVAYGVVVPLVPVVCNMVVGNVVVISAVGNLVVDNVVVVPFICIVVNGSVVGIVVVGSVVGFVVVDSVVNFVVVDCVVGSVVGFVVVDSVVVVCSVVGFVVVDSVVNFVVVDCVVGSVVGIVVVDSVVVMGSVVGFVVCCWTTHYYCHYYSKCLWWFKQMKFV